MSGARKFAFLGAWGAALTVVILAMSVYMRLGTRIDGDIAVSVLPEAWEQAARWVHRISAMAVGILAALVLVLAAGDRPVPRARRLAIACIVALTLVLSIVGRYTPGYFFDGVTVANVVGGMGLAAAFWWLRADPQARADPVAVAALLAVLAQAGLGAATDAAAMRGEQGLGPLHLWFAVFFIVLILVAAWRQRARARLANAVAAVAGTQFVLGFFLIGVRPMALAWVHSMVACVLALLLVSLAVGTKALGPQMNTDEHG
jgi:heme A synthase